MLCKNKNKLFIAFILGFLVSCFMWVSGTVYHAEAKDVQAVEVYDFSQLTQEEKVEYGQTATGSQIGSFYGENGLNKAIVFNLKLPDKVGDKIKFGFFSSDGVWSEDGKVLFVHNEHIALRSGTEGELTGEYAPENCWYNFSDHGGVLAPSTVLKIEVGVKAVYEGDVHIANRYYVKYNDQEIIAHNDETLAVPGKGIFGPLLEGADRENGAVVTLSGTLEDTSEAETTIDYFDLTGNKSTTFTTEGDHGALGKFDLTKKNVVFTMNVTMPSVSNTNWLKFGLFANESGGLWGDMPGFCIRLRNSTEENPEGGEIFVSKFDETKIASVEIPLKASNTYAFKFQFKEQLSEGEAAGQRLLIFVDQQQVLDCRTKIEYGEYLRAPYLENENQACTFATSYDFQEGEITESSMYSWSDIASASLCDFTAKQTTPVLGELDAAPEGNVLFEHKLIIPKGMNPDDNNTIKYGLFVEMNGSQIWDAKENTGIVIELGGEFIRVFGGPDASFWGEYKKSDGQHILEGGKEYVLSFSVVDLLKNDEKIGNVIRILLDGEKIFEKETENSYKLGTKFVGPYLNGNVDCAFADKSATIFTIAYENSKGLNLSGPRFVLSGSDAEINVLTEPGYRLATLMANQVDQIILLEGNKLNLQAITENIILEGTAEYVTFTVGFEANELVEISVNKNSVEYGSEEIVVFTIVPKEGNKITGLYIGEEDFFGYAQQTEDGYTLSIGAVDKDTILRVESEKIKYEVKVAPYEHGTVNLSAQTVEHGGSVTVNIVPDKGYKISSVKINGEEQKIVEGTIKIDNVTAAVMLDVLFAKESKKAGCTSSSTGSSLLISGCVILLAACCLITIKSKR